MGVMSSQKILLIQKECQDLGKTLATFSSQTMPPWQICGFLVGLVCAGADHDEDQEALVEDILDEAARAAEGDEPAGFHGGPPGECLAALGTMVQELLGQTRRLLDAEDGDLELPFSESAAHQGEVNLKPTDLLAARQFAAGLLRGVPFGVADPEELEDESWGEPLGLLYILSEDDPDPDFGNMDEISQARAAVCLGLPGIIQRLYHCGQ